MASPPRSMCDGAKSIASHARAYDKMQSWAKLGLSPLLLANLEKIEYAQEPNKLQMTAVSAILAEPPRNVRATSERQSGRTLAFCVGLAARVLQSYGSGGARHVQAIVLSKDMRRSQDVVATLEALFSGIGPIVRILAPYGNHADSAELVDQKALEQPLAFAHVVVGCHFSFSASMMRAHFSNVGILVLDEFADSMWLQTISKSLLLDLRHLKQVLCFSAHAIAPSQQPVLEAICSNAIEIDETRDASGCGSAASSAAGSAASCAPPAGWSAQMRHYYVDCHGKNKLEALELLLRVLNRGTMATVVFSNDQSECMWLCDEMIAQGREAYCVCPMLMDDAECQKQRDAFVNRIGSSTVDMFCTNLWSMLFWKALVRINFSTPANVDDYMEQAQYRKAGHVVSGKFVGFKNHKIVITFVQEPEEIVRFDTLRERLRETITFEPLPLDDEVAIERLVATDENGEPRRRV